jgi:cytochrome c-type biogenesis protein
MISFIFFGIGIAFPLFFLSILSLASGKRMISFLLKYKKLINVFSGLIMLIISIYYLVFIFKIFS